MANAVLKRFNGTTWEELKVGAYNSDKLGGYSATTAATANTVVVRDASNYIYADYINSNGSVIHIPSSTLAMNMYGTDNEFYISSGADASLNISSYGDLRLSSGYGYVYTNSGRLQVRGTSTGGTNFVVTNTSTTNYTATFPNVTGTVNLANTTTTASRILLSTSTEGQAVWSSTTIGTMAYQASTSFATTAHVQSATYGGTGQTTYAVGDILYASATNTLSKLAKPSTPGYILRYPGNTPGYATWSVPTPIGTAITANTTLTLAHSFSLFTCSIASGTITITIPANTSVAFPIGTQIDFIRAGAGELAFTILTDTLLSEGNKRRVNAQNQAVTLIKTASTI